MTPAPSDSPKAGARWLRVLRPFHQHSAYSATALLMTAVLLSRVIGYVREAYIAYAFGAGPQTDAYVAAFTLPDWLNYLVAGGTASITFISIFTRYTSQGREAEAQQAFRVIITVMTTVLVVGIALVMIFARPIERAIFPGFTEEQLDLCVYLTRILLPAQVFFYVGGISSAVLLSRRMFVFPALGPLLYSVFIILGGVLLSPYVGIAGLAYGAVAGGFLGPFLINAWGAHRAGVRYRPSFDVGHAGFREWVTLSIPLMLGVSLVTADEWILRFFASAHEGDITRLHYAKRLFAVPIAVLGQAAGQASLPFFARLFGEGKREEFAATVNTTVFRMASLSLLASAWMVAVALPLVDLVYRRGRFEWSDAQHTALYLLVFSFSLVFWAAQALYARAFYAAGNTLTPMVAGTIVALGSLPVYSHLFAAYGVVGLALASNIGILAHTVVLAALLSRRGLVPLSGMRWREMAKVAATALVAGALSGYVAAVIPLDGSRLATLGQLALASVTWAAAVIVGLWLTRSELPRALQRRRKVSEAPERQAEQFTPGSGREPNL